MNVRLGVISDKTLRVTEVLDATAYAQALHMIFLPTVVQAEEYRRVAVSFSPAQGHRLSWELHRSVGDWDSPGVNQTHPDVIGSA